MANWNLDVSALYRAVNEKREAEGYTWQELARLLGIAPVIRRRLLDGKAPDPHTVVTILKWLEADARDFAYRRADLVEAP